MIIKRSLFFLLFILTLNSYAQEVEDLELESLDDMEMLKEFNDDIADEEISEETEIPEEEIDGLSEEEKLLLGELNEVSDEEVIFNKLSQQEAEEVEKESIKELQEDEDLLKMAEDINFDSDSADEDFGEFSEFSETVEPVKLVETLAEKQQKERDLFDELSAIRQKEVEQKIEQKIAAKKARYTPAQVHALKVQLKDISSSPLVYANIKKKTKLISIENDKVYNTMRDITVQAYTLADGSKFRYVVDKKGELKYKVYHRDISNIKNVTNLYHRPHYFSRIKKVQKVSLNDKKFDYSLRFNLHAGLTLTQYTSRILGGTENYAPMIRTELGVMSNLKYPVQMGLAGVYESVTGTLKSGGKYSTKILSFGPTIMKDNIFSGYDLIVQPRISVFANLSQEAADETKSYKLSDTSLLIGLERHTDYKMFGKLTLGYNFQRKWIKPKAQSSGFNIGADVPYDDSFAMYIGHRSDWIW